MADEYAQVQRHLEAKGLKITTCTIVDTRRPLPQKCRQGARRATSGISA
jgi:hypothetical protein